MKKKLNLSFEAVSLLIGMAAIVIAFFVATFFIRQPRSQAEQLVKSTFVPRVIIFGVAVSALICVLGDFKKSQERAEKDDLLKIGLSVLIMFISILLLDYLGFVLIGTLFMFSQMMLLVSPGKDRKKTLMLLGISFASAVVFSLIFRYGFNIGIPVLPFS